MLATRGTAPPVKPDSGTSLDAVVEIGANPAHRDAGTVGDAQRRHSGHQICSFPWLLGI